jgi:hypothetical protein
MKRIAIPALTLTLLSILASATVFAAPHKIRTPTPSRAEVRDALIKRRAVNRERLRVYRERMQFPRNRISPDVINVFRDENGLLCAVANLIFLDGKLALVAKTARENNTVKMGELESGPLHDWILSSGFTIEEIAAIQLPDSPVRFERDWEEMENLKIMAHLAGVETMLEKNDKQSIEMATDRLIAAGSVRTLLVWAALR